ncbi:hypothetical protein BH10PAT1_BH10PAT1_5630 [soil metagenome]
MEQHAVPQNISSYQFHLVGDMTLKQFLELAAGVLVAVLFYATPLPAIIKAPLIIFSVAFGAALAFVPFEERPLEQWIFAFIRSVYSPTLFHWEHSDTTKYFQDETQPSLEASAGTAPANPFAKIPFLSNLDNNENSYLSKLSGLFNPTVTASQPSTTPTQIVRPQITPQQIAQPQMVTASMQPNATGTILTMHPQNIPQPMQTNEEKKEVQIPQTTYISVDKHQARPQMVVQEIAGDTNNLQTTHVSQTLNSKTVTGSTAAQFSVDAAPPSLPTIANTVSGQVMDNTKRIIEGAILEIVDETGHSVRALRTNKVGHFLIVTPLTNGKYKLIVEKEGYKFNPVSFETTGGIIQPIAIEAQ